MDWKPANRVHAIDRVALSIRWIPLPVKPLRRMVEMVKEGAGSVGLSDQVMVQPSFAIELIQDGQNPPRVVQRPEGPASQTFRRIVDGKAEFEIVCNADSIVAVDNAYQGWDAFKQTALASIREGATYVVDEIQGALEIRLEYWDRFMLPTGGVMQGLLNPASKLLGPYAHEQQGSWHSHTGFFHQMAHGVRSLINANVDVVSRADVVSAGPGAPDVPPNMEAVARIYSLVTAQRIAPSAGFEKFSEIQDLCESQHSHLKGVLADMISPEMASAISLNSERLER